MRSFGEIQFRLRQEVANAGYTLFPPRPALGEELPNKTLLPDPASVRSVLAGTHAAQQLLELAASILEHRIPLLGHTIPTGSETRWRQDYLSGVETEALYFRRIPYLDPRAAGDHKTIWELNRHQHLVVLGQGYVLSGNIAFLEEIERELVSWFQQNPFNRGINWASALEVGFRALSWIWILQLVGIDLQRDFRRRLAIELYRHGVYLEHNLSVYFSPNTHLLGEAVALHALGVLFPRWPKSRLWREIGRKTVLQQMDFQVHSDGSHFEQSTAYHVYAVDFFLLHTLLERAGSEYEKKLSRMVDYLAALCDEQQRIPLMGDDDGGRLFHPYGDRRRFAAATLATSSVYLNRSDLPCREDDLHVQAAWWIGPAAMKATCSSQLGAGPRLFKDAGVAVFSQSPVQLIADTRAFGYGGAGHSHAHALSLVCGRNGKDILLDPGTFTYVAEPEWRDRFRGTAAHNTVMIDGASQAEPAGPFRWRQIPQTQIVTWTEGEAFVYLEAECFSRLIRHSRHIIWVPHSACFAVLDRVEGPGTHRIEQRWHSEQVHPLNVGLFCISESITVRFPGAADLNLNVEESWQSEAPGSKAPRKVLIAAKHGPLPLAINTLFCLEGEDGIRLIESADAVTFETPVKTFTFLNTGGTLRMQNS